MTKQNKAYQISYLSKQRTGSVISEKRLVVFVLSTIKCWQNARKHMKSSKMTKKALKKVKIPTPAKYKDEFPFLKEVDSLALANAQINLQKAYKSLF